MTDDEIGHAIIGAAMKAHSTVGPAPWTVAELPPSRRLPVRLFAEFPCCAYARGYCADAEWLL